MFSAGLRQLSRSPNPGLPERDRAQCCRVLPRAGEHVIDVGAGYDETRAEADQLALQRDIVADAADTQDLAMRPAGLGNPLISRAQTRVVDLPRDTVIRRQVARADQQDVDAWYRGDRVGILDAGRGFEHDSDCGLAIEPSIGLAERQGAIAERRSQPHHRTPANRREAAMAHDRLGLRAVLDI